VGCVLTVCADKHVLDHTHLFVSSVGVAIASRYHVTRRVLEPCTSACVVAVSVSDVTTDCYVSGAAYAGTGLRWY
jgi:hypothetical protein